MDLDQIERRQWVHTLRSLSRTPSSNVMPARSSTKSEGGENRTSSIRAASSRLGESGGAVASVPRTSRSAWAVIGSWQPALVELTSIAHGRSAAWRGKPRGFRKYDGEQQRTINTLTSHSSAICKSATKTIARSGRMITAFLPHAASARPPQPELYLSAIDPVSTVPPVLTSK